MHYNKYHILLHTMYIAMETVIISQSNIRTVTQIIERLQEGALFLYSSPDFVAKEFPCENVQVACFLS